jgi:Ras association domain-containing protein 2/4
LSKVVKIRLSSFEFSRSYNMFYNNKSLEVKSREVNGRLILEGALRIYWGIQGVIHLKEDDDQRTVVTIRKRHSVRYPHSVDIVSTPRDN